MKFDYCAKYDAYFDVDTDTWTESPCADPECVFCPKRPSKPSLVTDD